MGSLNLYITEMLFIQYIWKLILMCQKTMQMFHNSLIWNKIGKDNVILFVFESIHFLCLSRLYLSFHKLRVFDMIIICVVFSVESIFESFGIGKCTSRPSLILETKNVHYDYSQWLVCRQSFLYPSSFYIQFVNFRFGMFDQFKFVFFDCVWLGSE